ncbi:MAG: hypothetical protein Q9170_007610 [Blastenia crenularia]
MDKPMEITTSPPSVTSKDSESLTVNTTVLSDPTLLLFQRMNELSMTLITSRPAGKDIVALNRKLDELEYILSGTCRQDQDEVRAVAGNEDSEFIPGPDQINPSTGHFPVALSPSKSIRQREHAKHTFKRGAELMAKVVEAMEQLRISHLMDDEAELTYLKLKLRTIEIQTLPYVAPDDYDGLAAGIRRWKSDWSEVRRRQGRRRMRYDLGKDEYPSPGIKGGGRPWLDDGCRSSKRR